MSLSLAHTASEQVLALVLVMCRVGGIMVLAPVFASQAIPKRVKGVFTVFLSIVFLHAANIHGADALSAGTLALIMAKEIAIGLAIGLAAGAVVIAWQTAGAILDLTVGFSFAGIIDPSYGTQTGPYQQLLGLTAVAVYVAVGGDALLMKAVAHSYQVMPVMSLPPVGSFGQFAVLVASGVFVVALGICGPILIALLVVDVAFAVVSRIAPQTQIIQIEFPLKIAVSLIMVMVCLPFATGALKAGLVKLIGVAFGGA